jgi:hypothetical protein
VAERASNFAGQFMFNAFLGGIVPFEVMMPVCEVDIFFVEYGRPLEWRRYVIISLRSHCRFSHFQQTFGAGLTYRAVSDKWYSGTIYCPAAPVLTTDILPSRNDNWPHT